MSELGDDALVVRGGLLLASDLERAVEVCRATFGYPGISVYAADGMSVAELVLAAGIQHRQLRRSTGGRLRAAGFSLTATGRWPHHTLRMTDGSAPEIERMRLAFHPPEADPRPGP